MAVYSEIIKLNTLEGKVTYLDITQNVNQIVKESKINKGICVVISPHTTCSVFFEEFVHDINEEGDEFLQVDLNNVLNKIIPPHENEKSYNYPGKKHYEDVMSWDNAEDYLPGGDISALWNGDAHLKSTLLGTSQTFAINDNKVSIGKTGYIYFVDFDVTRERNRNCQVVVIGE